MFEYSWVARSSGNMTLEIFDETIQKQILKIDMLRANTMKAGTNGDVLCRALNDLHIIALCPEILESLYRNDSLISEIPSNNSWSYIFNWIRSYEFITHDFPETTVDFKRFFEVLPYPEVGFSKFPWKTIYEYENRRIMLRDANNRVIADKKFSKTFPEDDIYRLRVIISEGIKYLNQFIVKNSPNDRFVTLQYYVNELGACAGFLYYHAATELELCQKIIEFLEPSTESLFINGYDSELKEIRRQFGEMGKLDYVCDGCFSIRTLVWGHGVDGMKTIVNCLKSLVENWDVIISWLFGYDDFFNSDLDWDDPDNDYLECKRNAEDYISSIEENLNYAIAENGDIYSLVVPYLD